MPPDPIVRPPLVLVAEDDNDIRALIRVLLVGAGLAVVEAGNGDEALAILESLSPDLALLDIEMPRTGGYEVLAAMRASGRHTDTPALFVTARGDTQHIIEGLELGARDYLTKPFNGRELVARVKLNLRVKAGADSLRDRNTLLQDAAGRDGLTGIHNRRHLDEQLVSLGSGASRHHRSLAALMLDIDRFKAVNDRHGHPVGDAVLRKVAELLDAQARTEDVVGRYGGEEFLFLLPDTDLDGAFHLGERIRRAVERAEFALANGDTLRVTISIGCAAQNGGDPSQLVRRADHALYEAKADGRNACRRAASDEPRSAETFSRTR